MNEADERDVFQGNFLALLARSPPATPFEVWSLCCHDPWLRKEVGKQARRLLEGTRGPPDLWSDIQQEAMLVLLRSLERDLRLGLEAEPMPGRFQALMVTVLRNSCREAYRKGRKDYQFSLSLPQDFDFSSAVAKAEANERDLELHLAIDDLPEQVRSVVLLVLIENSKSAASDRLKKTIREVTEAWDQGINRLRKDYES